VRILLAHNSAYYPSFGGGEKSNRLLMAALAARGHQVRVLARVAEYGGDAHTRLAHDLERRGISVSSHAEDIQFMLEGVDVRVFTRGLALRTWASAHMQASHPDIILTSTDDPAHLMLTAALQVHDARVIYLVRAIIALPFGPASSLPSSTRSDTLRRTDGSAAVSEYVAQYAREWGGLGTVHVPISLPDRIIFPNLGNFDNRFVTMVNPCAGKGLAVFLALAWHFPDVRFAAVPTWGTTEADLAALRALPNITTLLPTDNIDDIFRQTRVVVVPSLWAEARSRVTLEALARAIPVLASNVGGMAEAMLGLDYVLPVNPVTRYRPSVDELMVPVMEIPQQDPQPWIEVLGRLLSDRVHYDDLSARSRATALAYARGVTVEPFEAYLKDRLSVPRRLHNAVREHPVAAHPVHSLSPHMRRLLAARLKRRVKE
jgi:glycosyltransferase involved in cell wall biosynthesis